MKKKLLFLALALVCLLAMTATTLAENSRLNPAARVAAQAAARRMMPQIHLDARRSLARLAPMARLAAAKPAQEKPFDVTNIVLTFDADEAAGSVSLVATMTIKAKADDLAQTEFFVTDLGDFTVEDEAGNPVDFAFQSLYGTQVLVVTLPAPLDNGETVVLKFFNSGIPACVPDDYFGMQFCAVSAEITYFDNSNSWVPAKLAMTYEEYWSGDTQIDYDVTTPPDYVVATTGELTSIDNLNDHWVHHFSDQTGNGIIGLAYARYQTWNAATPAVPALETYIHVGDTTYGQQWADIAGDIVNYYNTIYTPYEYPRNNIVQMVEAFGGGESLGTMTFYVASALNTSPEVYYSEELYSHEIGHSWWALMYRNGDTLSPWLTEGVNEYSALLYSYRVWPAYYVDYYYSFYFHYFQFYVDPSEEVPLTSNDIFTDDSMIYFLTTYEKGAYVMRMLEWLLGKETVLAGMKALGQEFDYAQTQTLYYVDDLQRVMEEASGADLENFFQQWVFSTGYPVYRWAAEFGQDGDQYTVRVRIEQVQEIETVFDLPIEVAVYVGEADEPQVFRVEFEGKVADQTFAFDEKPRGVRVDDAEYIWGDKVPALFGDVEGSNEVDGIDLIYAAWSQGGSILSQNPAEAYNYLGEADFNRDGLTNQADLEGLLANFGKKGTIDE